MFAQWAVLTSSPRVQATCRKGSKVAVYVCVCVSAVHGNRVAAKRLCHSLQGTKLRKGSICECACVCRYPIIDQCVRVCLINGTTVAATECARLFQDLLDSSSVQGFPCPSHTRLHIQCTLTQKKTPSQTANRKGHTVARRCRLCTMRCPLNQTQTERKVSGSL